MSLPAEQRQCIYCLRKLTFSPARKFRTEDWSREHVLQQAFGQFENALTLVGRVCSDCNSYFGKTLDVPLSRSGVNEINRFKHGSKDLQRIGELKRAGLEFRFACPGDDVLDGACLEFFDCDGQVSYRLANQYAFRDKLTNEWISLPEEQFHSEDPRIKFPSIGLHDGPCRAITLTAQKNDELITRAYYKGVHFPSLETSRPNQSRPMLLGFSVEKVHQRAMAKNVFNYLAKTTEYAPDLVLSSIFNPLRSFILAGEDTGWQITSVANQPMLVGENRAELLTHGHLISINCERSGSNVVWKGQISIYNEMVFDIVMTGNPAAIYYPISSCHLWDVETKKCRNIPGINRDFTLVNYPALAVTR